MPRETQLQSSQRSRDEGMARLRSITFWSGAGAGALTLIASLIAATTVPGRTTTEASSSTPGSSGTTPAQTEPLPTADPGQTSQAAPTVPDPSQFQQQPIVSGGS